MEKSFDVSLVTFFADVLTITSFEMTSLLIFFLEKHNLD